MHNMTSAPETTEMSTLKSFLGSLDRRIDPEKMLQAMAWTVQAMAPACQATETGEVWHWIRLNGSDWMPAKRVGDFWHSVGLAAVPLAMVTVGPSIDRTFGRDAALDIPSEESPFAIVESLRRMTEDVIALRRGVLQVRSNAHLMNSALA